MMKDLIHQEDITIMNIYGPNSNKIHETKVDKTEWRDT